MEFQEQFILIRNTFLGDIQVRYYGIIIVTAMLVAATVAARLAQGRKYDPDHVWGALTWAIFPGIIFARLWFVVFPPATLVAGCGTGGICQDFGWYMQNFFNTTNGAIAIWSGGLSIFGAVLGGLLGVWLYFSRFHNVVAQVFYVIFYPFTLLADGIAWVFTAAWQRITRKEVTPYALSRFVPTFPAEGMPMVAWVDIGAVVLPLAQFIGRWANYVNQELYGSTTTLPWGITISMNNRVAPYLSPVDYPIDTLFHPLFLYEGLWSLVAFFILFNVYTRNRNQFKVGDFLLLYIIQYSFIRFFLEFLRAEVAYLPGTTINSSQAFTALLFAVALAVFLVRRSRPSAQSYDEATVMPATPAVA